LILRNNNLWEKLEQVGTQKKEKGNVTFKRKKKKKRAFEKLKNKSVVRASQNFTFRAHFLADYQSPKMLINANNSDAVFCENNERTMKELVLGGLDILKNKSSFVAFC
jgi:hypothetical protein